MKARAWLLVPLLAGCGGGRPEGAPESPPVLAVRAFYEGYRTRPFTGLPDDSTWTRVAAHFSRSLSDLIAAAQATQAKCRADHPDDKPPWIEGDLFSSNFEGFSRIGRVVLEDSTGGARQVDVGFEYEDRGETVRWQDRVVVIEEGGRWVIDDVIYGRTGGFGNGFGSALRRALAPGEGCSGAGSDGGFVSTTIDTSLTDGYQVVVADLNRDGKPDIIVLASGLQELRWYENPRWERHVIVAGINEPINAAAYDVDGDGIPEIALAQGFSNVYAKSSGIVSILTHQGDSRGPWSMKEIDRVPTSHRLRFANIDGAGSKVLVNFPLIGSKAAAPDYRDRLSLLMYRPSGWKREVITDAEEGVVHGIVAAPWNGDARESLLSASFLGVHAMRFDQGRWRRSLVVKGDPAGWPKSGASEVVVGHLGRERFLATIEPWHGNQVVVYRQVDGAWKRHVLDDTITDGHTIVLGDFDGDGADELIVGERKGRRSVYRYRLTDAGGDIWSKQVLDNAMPAAGCAVADLNADQRPDVVCIGDSTATLKWYANRP